MFKDIILYMVLDSDSASCLMTFTVFASLLTQAVHPGADGDQHSVDSHHPVVAGQPAVRLHPAGLQLPPAAHLRRLPARRLLEENQRAGAHNTSLINCRSENVNQQLSFCMIF